MHIPCLWIGKISIVKMSIQPQTIYRFKAIPIKLTTVFLTDQEQIISQFVCKYKKTQISKATLRKKNGAGLTSGYIEKPHSSRQYGTGTKTEI